MRRYIRTKDGKIYKRDERYNETVNGYITCIKGVYVQEKAVIKQADTVEELCDMLVAEKDGNHVVFPIEDRKTWETRYCVEYGWNIYGAVWTDEGLIYRAKMNKEGELELL